MLRTLFNKIVKEPLMRLQNSNFANAFRAMLQPRAFPALKPALVPVRNNRSPHLRR